MFKRTKCFIVVVLPMTMALLITGLATNLVAQDENPWTSEIDVARGQDMFERHCAQCHGMEAAGGEFGPALSTGQFRHASTNAGLYRVIAEGVPNTEMIGWHRGRIGWTRSIWQLVSYLNSLNPRAGNLVLPGDSSIGKNLYQGKGDCTSCHMIKGQGGRLGPDLSIIADQRSPDEMKSDLLDPDEHVSPRWWSMRVTHLDGTKVEGIRLNEDTYSVRILDLDEQLWSFLKRDLRESQRIETSSMPSYRETLTDKEVDDVIAYLYTLRRE